MSDLTEIHRSLGRIEGKLDGLVDRADKHIDDHEKRIGALEGSHRWFIGVATGAGAVAGAAFSWAITLLGLGGTHGIKQ
jgi:hypothetical protein